MKVIPKAMFKPILITTLLFSSFNGYSNGIVEGFNVVDVRVDDSGLGFIRFDKPLAGSPAACISGGHTHHLSFDVNTEAGKSIMSLALAAQASGKKVIARGTGNCKGYGVVERWSHGWVRSY